MSKKALVIVVVVGLTVVITGLILFLSRDDELPLIEDQVSEEKINLTRLPNNWQLIENTKFRYAFEIPPSWKAQLIGDDVEASFRTDAFEAVVSVNGYSNPGVTELQKWIEQSEPSEMTEITKGNMQGLRYVGRELVESYEGNEIRLKAINESYLLGNIFKAQGQIIDIRCSVTGPNYKTMIPTCEEIVESFRFIE